MSSPGKQRVFLTGATGFVGSFVAREVLSSGQDVYALVRPGSDRWRIADLSTHPRLHVLEGDLADGDGLARHLEKVRPDTCIHLAWYAEHGKYWTGLENLDMLEASLNLARQLAEVDCGRFVGVGTCVEYAPSEECFSEERSALHPASLYAASKLALYYLLEQLGQQFGMEVAWLRFFYLYGPTEDPRRLVPYVVRSLLAGEPAETTSGEQVRDYLHVADAASAVWAVARSDLAGAVNIGSGQPVSVAELVTRIGQVMGRPDLIRLGARPTPPDEPGQLCAVVDKLKTTGWSPHYDLGTGLEDTAGWWARQGANA